MQAGQQSHGGVPLVLANPPQNLVNVHRADERNLARLPQVVNSTGCITPTQRVDKDGRVEQQRQASADPARVGKALCMDPSGWIGVPLVSGIRDRPKSGLNVFPSPLIVECPAQCFTDKCAAPAPADTLVELLDEVIIQAYVQTHGHRLTHRTRCPSGPRPGDPTL